MLHKCHIYILVHIHGLIPGAVLVQLPCTKAVCQDKEDKNEFAFDQCDKACELEPTPYSWTPSHRPCMALDCFGEHFECVLQVWNDSFEFYRSDHRCRSKGSQQVHWKKMFWHKSAETFLLSFDQPVKSFDMMRKISRVLKLLAASLADENAFLHSSLPFRFRRWFWICRLVEHHVNAKALKIRTNFVADFTSHRMLADFHIGTFLAYSTMLPKLLLGGDHRKLADRAEESSYFRKFVQLCDVSVESAHFREKLFTTVCWTLCLLHLTVVIF